MRIARAWTQSKKQEERRLRLDALARKGESKLPKLSCPSSIAAEGPKASDTRLVSGYVARQMGIWQRAPATSWTSSRLRPHRTHLARVVGRLHRLQHRSDSLSIGPMAGRTWRIHIRTRSMKSRFGEEENRGNELTPFGCPTAPPLRCGLLSVPSPSAPFRCIVLAPQSIHIRPSKNGCQPICSLNTKRAGKLACAPLGPCQLRGMHPEGVPFSVWGKSVCKEDLTVRKCRNEHRQSNPL